MTRRSLAAFAAALTFASAGSAWAADPVEQHNSTAIWFENWTGLSNATLKVVSPNGQITEIFTSSGTPVYQLEGGGVLDGIYMYEMNAATDETVELVNQIDNGRGSEQGNTATKPYYLTGHFTVSRGVIIQPEEITED